MEFNKQDKTVIDESTDNFFVKKTTSELAHEAAVAALKPNTERRPSNWIDAYSDCA